MLGKGSFATSILDLCARLARRRSSIDAGGCGSRIGRSRTHRTSGRGELRVSCFANAHCSQRNYPGCWTLDSHSWVPGRSPFTVGSGLPTWRSVGLHFSGNHRNRISVAGTRGVVCRCSNLRMEANRCSRPQCVTIVPQGFLRLKRGPCRARFSLPQAPFRLSLNVALPNNKSIRKTQGKGGDRI
jgi:hypothetical protein